MEKYEKPVMEIVDLENDVILTNTHDPDEPEILPLEP